MLEVDIEYHKNNTLKSNFNKMCIKTAENKMCEAQNLLK